MNKKSETTISEKSYSKGQSSYSLLKVFQVYNHHAGL